MPESFLLGRLLLQFNSEAADIITDLSAVALTPDGSLWLGSDETTSIERLSPVGPHIFGKHQRLAIADFIDLTWKSWRNRYRRNGFQQRLSLAGRLLTAQNAKKLKAKTPNKDIQNLAQIETEVNRYLLARIPVKNGTLCKSISHPDNPKNQLKAGYLSGQKREFAD
jgi:hypothetical protein